MFKIGKLEIDVPIVAAPLAGISNPVYRRMCRHFGAGYTVSEMISDKALHYENKKTQDMCRTVKDEHPVALQLFGSDPETMGEAARYLTSHTDCEIIDINMGCPVNKVIKAHAGSYLLQHEDLAISIVEAVVKNTDRPVTVKMRAGWDKDHINCATLAKAFEEVGAQAIAIHGRTKKQMYEGSSNNAYIKMVKDAVNIPVIGNGDIKTVDDMKRMFIETGCDAVMVGRGILGRPFFLQELNAALTGKEYIAPSYIERLNLCYEYAETLCTQEGERNAMRMMRGMGSWFVQGMPNSAKIRNLLSQMDTLEDMYKIIQDYKEALLQQI